jgi:hypothetical protein
MKPAARPGRPGLVGAAGLALLLAGCAQPEFDRAKWQSGRGDMTRENPRGPMRSEFERYGIVIGATRAHIRDLLGPSDDGDGQVDPNGNPMDTYSLGFPPFRMDSESLYIRYDRNARVVAIGSVQG